jgi:hypothetical protein
MVSVAHSPISSGPGNATEQSECRREVIGLTGISRTSWGREQSTSTRRRPRIASIPARCDGRHTGQESDVGDHRGTPPVRVGTHDLVRHMRPRGSKYASVPPPSTWRRHRAAAE